MKYHRASLILGVLLFVGCFGIIHNVVAGSYTPKNGFVPDKATAVRVAEAILVPIYGEKQIASERPFSAELKGGVWTVTGHLPEGWTGGVAEVRISKMTCQVISLSHGK